MEKIKSQNGKFTITESVSIRKNEIDFDLRCLSHEVTVADLADTIFSDIIQKIDLKQKIISCWVLNFSGEGKGFPIVVTHQITEDDILKVVSEQFLIS